MGLERETFNRRLHEQYGRNQLKHNLFGRRSATPREVYSTITAIHDPYSGKGWWPDEEVLRAVDKDQAEIDEILARRASKRK